MVEFFIDSSNIEEIKKWAFMVTGCTTNPKILSTDKCEDIEGRIKEIGSLIDGPISVEVFSETLEDMIEEANKYSKWHQNVVIKVPAINYDSLKTIHELKKRNIKTNATGCISLNQAIMAQLAGANYVSYFYGRIGDEGGEPDDIIKQTSEIFRYLFEPPKTIIGSIRSVLDVNRAVIAGADIITITPDIMKKLIDNSKARETIQEFNDSYRKFKGKL